MSCLRSIWSPSFCCPQKGTPLPRTCIGSPVVLQSSSTLLHPSLPRVLRKHRVLVRFLGVGKRITTRVLPYIERCTIANSAEEFIHRLAFNTGELYHPPLRSMGVCPISNNSGGSKRGHNGHYLLLLVAPFNSLALISFFFSDDLLSKRRRCIFKPPKAPCWAINVVNMRLCGAFSAGTNDVGFDFRYDQSLRPSSRGIISLPLQLFFWQGGGHYSPAGEFYFYRGGLH